LFWEEELTIAEQIQSLEALAALDAQLKVQDEEAAVARTELEKLHAAVKRFEDKVASSRSKLSGFEKARAEHVAEVRSMTMQIEHSRDKMSRTRTEREVQAVQREMEELRKLTRDREEELGRVVADLDGLRLMIDADEAELAKANEALAARRQDLEATIGAFVDGTASRKLEREELVKKLPTMLYRRYDQIRAKRGIGLATTTDGTCKGCHIQLPPQLFHRLRREPLLDQCQSCMRVIYYAPPSGPTNTPKE
jgi:predicted  nucleic acid-binding Zn-ribbon protein